MKVMHGRSGTAEAPVFDPISVFGQGWILFQRGLTPRGGKIAEATQNQSTSAGTFYIQGTPTTVLVVSGDLPAKVDALAGKIQELIDAKDK